MTTFESGTVQVWEKDQYGNLLPKKLFYEKGSIIIEESLTQPYQRGRENFTVIHEVFHQLLHRAFFQEVGGNALLLKSRFNNERHVLRTDYDFCEYHANMCAGAFLMPRGLVRSTLRKMTDSEVISLKGRNNEIVKRMVEEFSVSKEAMKIRLKILGLRS